MPEGNGGTIRAVKRLRKLHLSVIRIIKCERTYIKDKFYGV
jgi:hypothetical protein